MAQKKEKKMSEEVVVTEIKDVDFGDLELKIAKPIIARISSLTCES